VLLTSALQAQPIGIRQHNPGNLHGRFPSRWLGATSTDSYGYLSFRTDFYGLRALRINLEAYYFKRHLKTIRQIAGRWVRPPRNQQQVAALESYMRGVAQQAGVQVDSRLWLEDRSMEKALAKAIIYAEQGEQPYPESLLDQVFQN
jgi:hypothetical protein